MQLRYTNDSNNNIVHCREFFFYLRKYFEFENYNEIRAIVIK